MHVSLYLLQGLKQNLHHCLPTVILRSSVKVCWATTSLPQNSTNSHIQNQNHQLILLITIY